MKHLSQFRNNMSIRNKKGIEMSFNWLFAIIVGAVFIFLAIYASTSLIKTERQTIDSEAAQQLESLLNPLETSIEVSAKPRDIIFPSESRVLIGCDDSKINSASLIRVQTSSKLGDKWQDAGLENSVYSKYIFASKINQGKKFSSMIFPLNMPYKVGQIVVFWSDQKCLVNPPEDVKNLFGNTTNNIFVTDLIGRCPSKSQIICFSDSDTSCDVTVDFFNKRVRKANQNLFFEGNLMYGAIFADSDIYECNLRRLNDKRVYLAQLFAHKSQLIETTSLTGCSRNLQPLLLNYASINYNTSRNLALVSEKALELERANDPVTCKLWKEKI